MWNCTFTVSCWGEDAGEPAGLSEGWVGKPGLCLRYLLTSHCDYAAGKIPLCGFS